MGSLSTSSKPGSSTASEGPVRDTREPIQGFTADEIAERCAVDLTCARKLCAAVHQRGRDELLAAPLPRNIRRVDAETIASRYRVGTLRVVAREASKQDPFVKYLLACEDEARIEAVRIPLEHPGRFVVCVSSQVGCAMGCTFCATGRLGLRRNLEAWEIAEQVRVVRRELPAGGRVHGVVFQGMGEPLANVERVIQAIRVLHDPCGAAIEQRAITVCTVGIPGALRKLTAAGVRVRLGISVTAARPSLRRELVPVEKQNPLSEVLDAAAEFVRRHGDAPMLAVTTLGGVNTTDEDADALAALALAFRERTGVTPRLSLVPYNPIGGDDPFVRADDEAERFRVRLSAIGVPVVRRYSGGGDVGAACGQLAGAETVAAAPAPLRSRSS